MLNKNEFAECIKDRIFNIIMYLGIDENYLSLKKYRNQLFDLNEFLQEFSFYLKSNYPSNPIDAECLILIISELASSSIYDHNNDKSNNSIMGLMDLFNYCSFSNRSLHRLLDSLRSGAHVICNQSHQTLASSSNGFNNLIYIPLEYHCKILSIIRKLICNNNPSYISFPGDKDSFVQLSQIPIMCTKAYTMAIWIKMPVDVPNKGFILFRSRSPISGIDAIVSNPQYFGNNQNEQLISLANTNSDTTTMVLTIRTNTEKKGKDEMQGTINITPGKWQLITISQCIVSKDYVSQTSTDSIKSQPSQQPHVIGDRLTVTIDGSLVLEQSFKYPFMMATNDSLWVFGLGFNGLMSSMTLYPEELSISLAELMYSLGPNVSDLSLGVSGPQSSFDSGHLILGSQIAKGNLAVKACRFRPIFSIQPFHLCSDTSLPLSTTGKIYPEHIEMVPRMSEYDSSLNASMTGGVSLSSHKCLIDVWSESGGVSLILYMVWCYCRTMNNAYLPIKSQKGVKETDLSKRVEETMNCLKLILEIASKVISGSTDIKEQLIQMHGFHIIGLCLSNLKAEVKKQFIDKELIIGLIDLVNALGPDAKKGDGIAAAMQGVLFDFRIWGSCKLSILSFYLENISSLTLETGDQLFKSIGVQRILDIFRLHIVKFDKHVEHDVMNALDILKPEDDPAHDNKLVIECADCIHRLLIITMDAAKTFSLKMKTTVVPEIEILLKCLEETNSCLIAERILRILSNIRVTSSVSLIQAFIMNRYHETTVLSLLTKKGFSIEVRANSLINLFWLLGDELRPLPMQMIQSRRILNSITMNIIPLTGTPNLSSKNKYVSTLDSNRIKSLNKQILELLKPIEKAWMTMNMLSEVLSRSLTEGTWGKVYNSSIEIAESNLFDIDITNYVAEESLNYPKILKNKPLKESSIDIDLFINSIIHNGKFEAWLLLPFLPVILSRSSLPMCQSVVMALNVALKTDETHCEAIASLPDRSWIKLFISMACIGESFTLSHFDDNEMKADLSIASTCTEISLDGLSLVIEYKTRHHFNDTWSTWNCLQNCIRIACSTLSTNSNEIELKFLKRCVSLVFQRLLKSSDGWNINLLNCLTNVFSLIDTRKLCGQTVAHQDKENLLDLDFEKYEVINSTPNISTQSAEEGQILCYMIDMMASLRKAAVRGAMSGYEWKVMKPALMITLSCLKSVPESIVDRIASEVLNHLKYMTEPWAPLNAAQFKANVMLIISHLRGVIEDVNAKDYLKGRYSALVFCIMHMFIDIRHLIASGKKVPEHVLPALEDLVGVVNCNDIDLIFKLMDVTMRTANSISFQEDDQIKSNDDTLLVELHHLTQQPQQKLGQLDISEHELSDAYDSSETTNLSPKVKDLLEGSSLFGKSSPIDEIVSTNSTSDCNNLEDTIENLGEANLVKAINSPELVHTTNSTEIIAPIAINIPANSNRDARYKKWVKIRQGILSERVDSERGRLSRSMDTLDLSSQATNHFWKKSRRKIESELFMESHKCQWKLGVAQEGHFPGRKRLVFRPRFHAEYGNNTESSSDDAQNIHDDHSMTKVKDTDELNRALAIACAGYIQDVTISDATDINSNLLGLQVNDCKVNEESSAELDNSTHHKQRLSNQAPGTGWGVVDADDSEEGYGVVGIAHSDQSITENTATDKENVKEQSNSSTVQVIPIVNDMMGDVRQLEENYKQGRCIETGPCHSGTKRVGSGPANLECRVIMVTASGNFWGSLSFNGKEIFFSSSFEQEDGHKEDNAAVNLVKQLRMRRRRWVLSSLSAIYMRRFRLRDSAMEVFFHRGKHRNFFVDFGHTIEDAKKRNEFARALITAAPITAFKQSPTMSAFRLVYEHGVQEKWLSGNMSNFDYLMALNTIAGRSYNDLCQYPVFPWIIADYNSPKLDLNDRSIYRDLSKPMGALNENRLKEFLDRFNSFEDNVSSGIPAFMYGSHYSTMVGVVLHFLVRLQPFAALHKEMQNGHFDVPDRLFSSIPRSFKHNTNQLSEVKELTPEWFTTPEMFKNINNFDLGKTQDGEFVDDVELPIWASTAEEFVRINREALESDYVTEHLHEWIDLIFGYKQRGPDAVEACNVFYYLTYYGSVNHYMIKDESLRRATELQIAHFGQIPMQLFKTPHPARKANVVTSDSPPTRLISKSFNDEDFVQPSCDEETLSIQSSATFINKQTNSIIINLSVLNDRVICVLDSGVVEVLKYGTSENAKVSLSLYLSDPKSLNRRKTANLDLSEHGHKSDDLIDMNDPNASNSKLDILIMPKNELLIFVEKEFTHFDIIPRIPLSKFTFLGKETLNNQDSSDFRKTNSLKLSSKSKLEQAAGLVKFNDTSNIIISTGHSDGRVCVREIDVKTGFVKSTGDYRSHRRRVVSLATDSIPSGNTDVIVSCDESGQIMVWTVSKIRNVNNNTSSLVISRRPQRLFRCEFKLGLYCDISWQMGIVVVACDLKVILFSIERDEMLRAFVIEYPSIHKSATFPCTGSPNMVFGENKTIYGKESLEKPKCFTRRIALSDNGNIIVHIEAIKVFDSLLQLDDEIKYKHCLISYSLSGCETGLQDSFNSAITFMDCPDRGSIVVTGHSDGNVILYEASNLSILYKFKPNLCCIYQPLSLTPLKMTKEADTFILPNNSQKNNNDTNRNSISNKPQTISNQASQLTTQCSPIISISFGPNKKSPAVLCIATESGNVFFRALPDFVKWEKNRIPSTLAQLASVPMKAVKGTIQQAQNWTAETAGVLAQNAKTFADELKKMNKNPIVKGFATFFGMGKQDSDDNSNK